MNENLDPYFDLPSAHEDEDDSIRYCSSEACDNELMPEDEDGLCQACEAERQEQAKYYEQMYRASKDYTRAEIEDVYSSPADYQKRERMLRDYK